MPNQIKTIQFSISIVFFFFFYKQLNVKTIQFQTIQFSISTQFGFISPIDKTLLGATTPGPSGPRSNGSEGVLFTQPLRSGRIWHKVNF